MRSHDPVDAYRQAFVLAAGGKFTLKLTPELLEVVSPMQPWRAYVEGFLDALERLAGQSPLPQDDPLANLCSSRLHHLADLISQLRDDGHAGEAEALQQFADALPVPPAWLRRPLLTHMIVHRGARDRGLTALLDLHTDALA